MGLLASAATGEPACVGRLQELHLELAELWNVEVQVMPLGRNAHAGLDGSNAVFGRFLNRRCRSARATHCASI
ncbi:hypothetical protein ACFWGR_12645 [Streptomyces sp. NPDC060311]|uniref:hypothetical protein n=1 Tax=Streptomyces sp. NPDC060311 TaxID=3347096 RepID=UPI003650FB02